MFFNFFLRSNLTRDQSRYVRIVVRSSEASSIKLFELKMALLKKPFFIELPIELPIVLPIGLPIVYMEA